MNVLICNGIVFFLVFCPLFIKPVQTQTPEIVDEGILNSPMLWEFRKNIGVQGDVFVVKAFDKFKEAVGEVRIFLGEVCSFIRYLFVSDSDESNKESNKNGRESFNVGGDNINYKANDDDWFHIVFIPLLATYIAWTIIWGNRQHDN